jgi:hypothetical protein
MEKRGLLRNWMVIALCMLLLSSLLTGCGSSTKESNSASVAQPASQDSGSVQFDKQSESKSVSNAVALTVNNTADKGNTTAAEPAAKASDKGVSGDNTPAALTPPIGADASEGFNRKLIYKGSLAMEVKDYAKAQTELRNLITVSGAYILQFSEDSNSGERGGNFLIKVAAGGFVSLLDGLERIAPSKNRNIQGSDVTEEYVDLTSRLKAKQAVETRLLSFMEKSQKTDELLAFSNELAKVQEEIERIKGRMRYLDQNVSYSTIELRMYQVKGNSLAVPYSELTLVSRINDAVQGSLKVLKTIFEGLLIFLAGAAPVLLLIALIAIPLFIYRNKRAAKLLKLRKELNQPPAHSNESNEDSTNNLS